MASIFPKITFVHVRLYGCHDRPDGNAEEKDDASLPDLLLQRAFLDRHIRKTGFPEFAPASPRLSCKSDSIRALWSTPTVCSIWTRKS